MFRPGTKPISEVLRGEVSKVDFILKNLFLYYTSGVGFSFILLFLNLFKSYKFSNVTYKVKSNIMSDHYSKRKSNIFQTITTDKKNSNKAQTVADLSDLAQGRPSSG